MNPPTEQLIRDYLNRLSVAARGKLGFSERQSLLDRTRARIEAECDGINGASAIQVRRALAGLGDPIAIVEREHARIGAGEVGSVTGSAAIAGTRSEAETNGRVVSTAAALGERIELAQAEQERETGGDGKTGNNANAGGADKETEIGKEPLVAPSANGFGSSGSGAGPEPGRAASSIRPVTAGPAAAQGSLAGSVGGSRSPGTAASSAPPPGSGSAPSPRPTAGGQELFSAPDSTPFDQPNPVNPPGSSDLPSSSEPAERQPMASASQSSSGSGPQQGPGSDQQQGSGSQDSPDSAPPPGSVPLPRPASGPVPPKPKFFKPTTPVASRRSKQGAALPRPGDPASSGGPTAPPASNAPADSSGPVGPSDAGIAGGGRAEGKGSGGTTSGRTTPGATTPGMGASGTGASTESGGTAPKRRASAGTTPGEPASTGSGPTGAAPTGPAGGPGNSPGGTRPGTVRPGGARPKTTRPGTAAPSAGRSGAARAGSPRSAGARPGQGRVAPSGTKSSGGGSRSPRTETAPRPSGPLRNVVYGVTELAIQNKVEILAIVLLGLGGAIYPPIWIIGAFIALPSRKWDIRDKFLGVTLPVVVVIVGTVLVLVLGGQHSSVGSYAFEAWLGAERLSRVAASVGALYLVWALWRGRREPRQPPWNVPHKLG